MSEHPIYCTAQTYAGSRFEPREYCETEVSEYGEMCEKHDEEERATAAYEAWREDSRYDD
jgi:hypothetical protein